jgi:acetyl-CoA carboxylase carboxyltransferase component
MGLEGAVRIIFKAELEAAPDDATRKEIFDRRVAEAYERGKALSMARYLEIDAVIDPADTRRWITGGLAAARSQRRRPPEKNPWVDTW